MTPPQSSSHICLLTPTKEFSVQCLEACFISVGGSENLYLFLRVVVYMYLPGAGKDAKHNKHVTPSQTKQHGKREAGLYYAVEGRTSFQATFCCEIRHRSPRGVSSPEL